MKYCVVGDSNLAADLRAAGCDVGEVHHNAAFNVVVAEMLQFGEDPAEVQCVVVGNDQRASELSHRLAKFSVAPILMLAGDSEPYGILDSHGVMHLPLGANAAEIMQHASTRMSSVPSNGSSVIDENGHESTPAPPPEPVILSGPLHEPPLEAAPVAPVSLPDAAESSVPVAGAPMEEPAPPQDEVAPTPHIQETEHTVPQEDSARIYPFPQTHEVPREAQDTPHPAVAGAAAQPSSGGEAVQSAQPPDVLGAQPPAVEQPPPYATVPPAAAGRAPGFLSTSGYSVEQLDQLGVAPADPVPAASPPPPPPPTEPAPAAEEVPSFLADYEPVEPQGTPDPHAEASPLDPASGAEEDWPDWLKPAAGDQEATAADSSPLEPAPSASPAPVAPLPAEPVPGSPTPQVPVSPAPVPSTAPAPPTPQVPVPPVPVPEPTSAPPTPQAPPGPVPAVPTAPPAPTTAPTIATEAVPPSAAPPAATQVPHAPPAQPTAPDTPVEPALPAAPIPTGTPPRPTPASVPDTASDPLQPIPPAADDPSLTPIQRAPLPTYGQESEDPNFASSAWADQVPDPTKREVSGTVIACTAAKGGVGKTAMSIWLSEALARCNKRVVLVDADLGNPNIALNLNKIGQSGGLDSLASATRFTTEDLREALLEMPGLGYVLAGPKHSLELSSEDAIKALDLAIRLLPRDFDFVIIDTPVASMYEPIIATILKHTTTLLVVLEPDATPIHDNIEWIRNIRTPVEQGGYGFPSERTLGVLNSDDPVGTGVDLTTVQSWFKSLPIIATVPKVEGLVLDRNQRREWRIPAPAVKHLVDIAEQLSGGATPVATDAPTRKKKGLFGRSCRRSA